jgi:hypothetical protein
MSGQEGESSGVVEGGVDGQRRNSLTPTISTQRRRENWASEH